MTGQADWASLWRELSLRSMQSAEGADPWRRRAASFDAEVKRRVREERDLLTERLVGMLCPTDTVMDIGAGTGRWVISMAEVVQHVTALEPSPTMLGILRENVAAAGIANLSVIQGRWEDTEVEPHDVALCSHSMYTSPDLAGFIQKMQRTAKRLCVLLLRVPSHDGVIGKLSQMVYGQWHDSPNFVIAYNILLEMGIYANVLMEPRVVRHWVDDTLEQAFDRAKKHLYLEDSSEHDTFIREELQRSLTRGKDGLVWPDGIRSALVWWNIGGE